MDVLRVSIRSADWTTLTLWTPLENPGAETVIDADPVAPSLPATWYGIDVWPFARSTVNDDVAVVLASLPTSTFVGSLLVTVTVTPPCCEAPSVAELVTCSDAPTICKPGAVMPGPVTDTEFVPMPMGSNARPYGESPPGDTHWV